MTKTVEEQLEDPDYRGHFQHCRGWDELDRLHANARGLIKDLREAGAKLLRTAEVELHDSEHALGVREMRAALKRAEARNG